MMEYTDTENIGAPAVPLLNGDDSIETMGEIVWRQ